MQKIDQILILFIIYAKCKKILTENPPTKKLNQKIRVVLVDDDSDITTVLKELLELNNISVVGIGSNGMDAIELYQYHRPDVIITDLIMPQFDGFFAVREIKNFEANSKIIVYSGSESVNVSLLKRQGVSAIIQKPYQIDRLLNAINETLGINVVRLHR